MASSEAKALFEKPKEQNGMELKSMDSSSKKQKSEASKVVVDVDTYSEYVE